MVAEPAAIASSQFNALFWTTDRWAASEGTHTKRSNPHRSLPSSANCEIDMIPLCIALDINPVDTGGAHLDAGVREPVSEPNVRRAPFEHRRGSASEEDKEGGGGLRAARRALAVDAVAVGIQGTNSVYQLGTPRWADFRWPGAPGAFVTVQRQLGPLTQDFEGDWAVFRLMEAASIRPRGGTAYDVSWSFRDGPHTVTVRYEMRTTSENSPLANPSGVLRFSLPRSAN